jgi:hypothetical protein
MQSLWIPVQFTGALPQPRIRRPMNASMSTPAASTNVTNFPTYVTRLTQVFPLSAEPNCSVTSATQDKCEGQYRAPSMYVRSSFAPWMAKGNSSSVFAMRIVGSASARKVCADQTAARVWDISFCCLGVVCGLAHRCRCWCVSRRNGAVPNG